MKGWRINEKARLYDRICIPSSDAEEKITMPNEKSTVMADYENENITIALSEYERYNTKIHMAEVWLASAEYLKTALANQDNSRFYTKQ